MSQFTKFRVQARDCGVYEVDAPEPAIVFTLMVSSLTEGRLLDMVNRRAKSIYFSGDLLSAEEAWSVVKDESWSLLWKVCASLVVIQRPGIASSHPNSLDRIALLTEEAARRVRSRRFEAVAAGSAN